MSLVCGESILPHWGLLLFFFVSHHFSTYKYGYPTYFTIFVSTNWFIAIILAHTAINSQAPLFSCNRHPALIQYFCHPKLNWKMENVICFGVPKTNFLSFNSVLFIPILLKGEFLFVLQIGRTDFATQRTRWGSAPQSRQQCHGSKIFLTENAATLPHQTRYKEVNIGNT